MPLHPGPRWHAFTHGLFRKSDKAETRAVYARVQELYARHNILTTEGRMELVAHICGDVLDEFGLAADHPQAAHVAALTAHVFDYEGLLRCPNIDWAERRTVAQWWDLRDELNRQRQFVEDFSATRACLKQVLVRVLLPIFVACPALLTGGSEGGDITVETAMADTISNVGDVSDRILSVFFDDDVMTSGLFSGVSDRLNRNLIAASGGNPADPAGFPKALKIPSKSDIKDPSELVGTYFGGTPLLEFFRQSIAFSIPTSSRFEHHHIVAGTGHGKTQTLQYLIGRDLDAVASGRRTVVVLDSQGDLISNIAGLAEFAPRGPLHDRVVIIDPTDVEYPVSLNLFDVGIDRLKTYEPLERERLTNSILELYDFVLGSLLSAEMTQKQNVIFRYVTRLMLHIPDATIHTLRELMEPGSQTKFAANIAKLTGTARHFFETEFASREFEQTKKQVLRRLWGILENQTFERMFSHPRSKLDLFSEMNAGKVILINTAKDLLKEQGSEIFGRFFIAMIAQAAQERATLPERDRVPTFVYVDEASDYFDRNIGIILAQARKYKVGMILAHQYLGQLEPRLQEAFSANTSIKFAGGVSAKDARTLAPMLYCDPAFIEAQPKGSFAAHLRGVTKSAVPLRFPFGFLESMPKMTPDAQNALRDRMRTKYAVHYSALAGMSEEAQDTLPETAPSEPVAPAVFNGEGDDSDDQPDPARSSTEAGFEL